MKTLKGKPDPFRSAFLGEILKGFAPAGFGLDKESAKPLFAQNTGGAPANELACFASQKLDFLRFLLSCNFLDAADRAAPFTLLFPALPTLAEIEGLLG